MAENDLTLIAFDIRKWDLEAEKLYFKIYFVSKKNEQTLLLNISLTHLPEMVEEFISKFQHEAGIILKKKKAKVDDTSIVMANETYIRQKVNNYFKRILLELNNPKRKKGQSRMIFSTHLDMYNENQDISFLKEDIRFFVVLNWARKYYEKEDYQHAIDPLRKLIKVKPDYGIGYKWLARSLKKYRKYDEAMRIYEKYAEVDQSLDAYLDLAKSYRKGKLYGQSLKIYKKILKDYPDDKEAQIGVAQIHYAQNNDKYLQFLDKLHKRDEPWFKDWLINEFNFRIYVTPKTFLTPIQAAHYIGLENVFELTQKAFRNEIPSHFNPVKARMSFYKEELDNWALVFNRYNLNGDKIKLYPEAIEADLHSESALNEKNGTANESILKKPKKDSKYSTRVEEILKKIRAAKAQRNKAGYSNKKASSRKPTNSGTSKKKEKEESGGKIKLAPKMKKNKKKESRGNRASREDSNSEPSPKAFKRTTLERHNYNGV